MKRLITQMLVVVALPVVALGQTGTGGAPARPALGDLLKLVPDEAALAAVIPDFGKLVAGIQAFGSAAGIADMAEVEIETLFDDLEITDLAGDWSQRIRKDGPFVFALTDPNADPLLICTVGTTADPPVGEFVELKGNVLVAAPDAGVLDAVKQASGRFAQRFERQVGAALQERDLAVLFDTPAWSVQIEQMLSLVEMFSQMGVATTTTQAAEANLTMVNWLFAGLHVAVDESETITFTTRIDADGVHVSKLAHFRPGGRVSEYLSKVRKSEKDLLRGLAAERGVIIMGAEWVLPPDVETLSEQMLEVMLTAGADQPTTSGGQPVEDAEWKQTVRRAMQLYRRVKGYNGLMTIAADRPGVVASGLYLTDDPPGVLESIPDLWEVSRPMMGAIAPGFSMEVADQPETVASVKARAYRLTFAADDEQIQNMLRSIYGESTTFYVAPHPEGVVYTMGPAELARQNLEKLLAPKQLARLADDQAVVSALKKLSARPQALVLADLPRLVKFGMQVTAAPEFERARARLPETPTPYAAFGLYLHEASCGAELFLPAKALKVFIDWFEEAGEPAPSSQPY